MDFENMTIWCWIIPLLVGAICGILGYLLGRGRDTTIDNSAKLKLLEDINSRPQADLDTCDKKVSTNATLGASTASFTAGEAIASFPFDAAVAKAVLGKTIKQDDLKVVEGIGPKIEGMLKDAGIKTWKSLSEATVANCQKVLDGGGKRYQVHDPASWPMQCKMAYEGKWKQLLKWQDEHNHGKL
jgi:predicted flap endonuclease-1-like 5' DNA nuclease